MDLQSVLIGIGILLLFIVPFFYLQIRSKQIYDKQVSELQKAAESRNLSLTVFDVWAKNYGIGLDEKSNTLIYYKKTDGRKISYIISVKNIISCKKITEERAGGDTQSIQLLLNLKNEETKEQPLDFFTLKERSSLFKIVPIADKWERLINAKLTK